MNTEFFQQKINRLSDAHLLDLLRLNADHNQEIIRLARTEGTRRNLEMDLEKLESGTAGLYAMESEEDRGKLKKWNWAAFLASLIWVSANGLHWWTVLLVIPPVNFFAMLYLGFHGNRLAYEKSTIGSVEDFMKLQTVWNKMILKLILISAFIGIVFLLTK